MSMVEVTVVVPTRNRASMLGQALRSVAAQREVDLEAVVVDDGSTDATAALVSGMEDRRVRLIRHERPQGVSAARNRGIAEARGPWVAFLDDDDLWAPGKLASQLAAAKRDGRAWAVTGAVSVDDRLRVLAGEPPLAPERIVADLDRYNSVPAGASNVLVRADLLADTGGFDPALRHMADWDLWIRLGRTGPPATVPRPLLAYRLHRANATMDTAFDPQEPLAELDAIVGRYGIPADRLAVDRWIAWTCLRAGRRGASLRAYVRAARGGDRRSLVRAAIGLLHPAVGRRIYYRPFLRQGQDEAWLAEARSWLRDLASG
jgi:glycosyltransferase involved in cell wall biosynthesis